MLLTPYLFHSHRTEPLPLLAGKGNSEDEDEDKGECQDRKKGEGQGEGKSVCWKHDYYCRVWLWGEQISRPFSMTSL